MLPSPVAFPMVPSSHGVGAELPAPQNLDAGQMEQAVAFSNA